MKGGPRKFQGPWAVVYKSAKTDYVSKDSLVII